MEATTLNLFYWIPRILFALIFVAIGYLGVTKKKVSSRLLIWIAIFYIIERAVETALRVSASFSAQLAAGYESFAYKRYVATLLPNLQSILNRELVIIGIAVVVWGVIFFYAKKTQFKKLDASDVSVFAFGVLVSGWPNFLIYLFTVFFMAFLGLLVFRALRKAERMIVTPYFALAGIIVLFWGLEISKFVGLYAIR